MVIRVEEPDTPDSQRLLRPAILEHRPLTKSEFVKLIPLYPRQATSSHESKYPDRVLAMIEEAETAVVTTA
jgi:hypothetical protein